MHISLLFILYFFLSHSILQLCPLGKNNNSRDILQSFSTYHPGNLCCVLVHWITRKHNDWSIWIDVVVDFVWDLSEDEPCFSAYSVKYNGCMNLFLALTFTTFYFNFIIILYYWKLILHWCHRAPYDSCR